MTRRSWRLAGTLAIALLVVVAATAYGMWLDWEWKAMIGWQRLVDYIDPGGATGRKDAVQVYAVIVAGAIAGITAGVGLWNLRLTRRNLNQQRELEAQRAEQQRELAQGTALQAYYEQIGNLITKHELRTTDREEIRQLARGQTVTVLHAVDGEGRGSLLIFLQGAGLIGGENPAFALYGADLSGADLRRANLNGANLRGANLNGANLSEANLIGANLDEAELKNADLRKAKLIRADLVNAELQEANLEHANMEDANMQRAVLHRANLRHASLRGADLEAVELEDADLSQANLLPTTLRINETLGNMTKARWERSIPGSAYRELFGGDWKHPLLQTELGFAKLARANLSDADLRYVNLYDADLQDTDLTRTNLQGATARKRAVGEMINEPANDEERSLKRDFDLRRNNVKHGSERVRPFWDLVPIERLLTARSLKDATLPDGSKHA